MKHFTSILPYETFQTERDRISEKNKFTGDIDAHADITINGEMYGRIKSARHVEPGESSRFEGDIECESALVCGHVRGCFIAERLLEVRKPAAAVGDLTTVFVQVESGGVIRGNIVSRPEEPGGFLPGNGRNDAGAVEERDSQSDHAWKPERGP